MTNNEVKEFFNLKAPSWDSREFKTRDDLIKYIDLIDLKSNDFVLDLGCGTGIISGLIKERVNKVIAMDISSRMIEIAKDKYKNDDIEFINEDFYKTQIKGFDKVIVFNAYPHFLDKEGFINKIYEVLNNDGEFYIIHSLSREELLICHENAQNVSFKLCPVEEEKNLFLNKFSILDYKENDHLYFIRGKKYEK